MERVPQQPQPHLPQEHKPRAISGARGMHLMKSALKALAHTALKVVPTHQHPLPCVSAASRHIVPCLMVLGPGGRWIWMSQQCAEPATVRGMWGKERGEKTGDVPHHPAKPPMPHLFHLLPAALSHPLEDPPEVCQVRARVLPHSLPGLG